MERGRERGGEREPDGRTESDGLAEWPRAQNRGVGGRPLAYSVSRSSSMVVWRLRLSLSLHSSNTTAATSFSRAGSLPPSLLLRLCADGLDKEKSERNSCRARRPDGRTRTPVLPLKDPRARKEYQKAESKSIPIPSRPTFEWQDVKLSIMGETMRFEVGAGKRERRVVVALCLDLGASGRADCPPRSERNGAGND